MIIGKTPDIAQSQEGIRTFISIRVGDARYFGLLSDEEGSIPPGEPRDFIESAGIKMIFGLWRVFKCTFDQVDVAPARSDGKSTVR